MKPELDDELRALARALRETKRGEATRPDKTRDAVLHAHAERGQRRGIWLAAAAVLVTLFSVPSAWALYTGYLAPRAPSAASQAPQHAPEPQRTTGNQPVQEASEAHVEAPVEHAPPEPTPAAALEPSRATQTHRSAPHASSALQHEVAIDPAERRAYERAHALHFDAHDAAGALTAWDAYLARYPEGRFAPEAQYNRALSLVRLGRRVQASEALAPFADGRFGSYRAREAQALLEALSEAP